MMDSETESEGRCTGECTGGGAGEITDQVVKEVSREPLLFKRHIKYFERVLNCLPCSLAKLDSNR